MRIFAGGDDQVHLCRLVLEHEAKRQVHRRGINPVVVVQNEYEGALEHRNLTQKGAQEHLKGGALSRVQHRPHLGPEGGVHRLQGG